MNIVFSGNLQFLSLSDVLQLIGGTGSSGILRISGQKMGYAGTVYISRGNPVDASFGSLLGLDALYALFGCKSGEFEYCKEKVEKENKINKSRMEIVLEGTKMVDDGVFTGASDPKKDPSGQIIVTGPLVDYMYVVDEEDYADGETIVNQGKHGNWNWVVLDGVVEIRKETPKGQIPILRVGMGSFIGSIAGLLLQSNVRSATVVAIGDVQLGVLDSQRLAMEYSCLTSDFKQVVLSFDKRIRQVTNKAVDIINKKKISQDNVVKSKDLFIKQGEKKEELYSIENGIAYIIKEVHGHPVLLATLDDGDVVGRLPFMNFGHEPNSAFVYASDDFQVSPLDHEKLHDEYEQLSTTFKNMLENSCDYLSVTTKIVSDQKTN